MLRIQFRRNRDRAREALWETGSGGGICTQSPRSSSPFQNNSFTVFRAFRGAGAALPADRPFDGRSLGPVLRGEAPRHRDWNYSHLHDGRILRDERWLLEIDKTTHAERLYDCGASRDGTGYRDVTGSSDPEVS